MKAIQVTLDKIKGGAGKMKHSPNPILGLVGPRGVGKTVLLERADEEAQGRGIHVGEVSREILSGPQDEIVSQVFPENMVKSFLDRLTNIGGSVAGAGVTVGLSQPSAILRLAMLDFLAKGPMLMILDEAHHCEPEGLSMLFNIVQKCMRSKLPLAFIVAGTPGLVSHLRQSEITYMERTRFLRFNTLSRGEAREALEVPAREAGRPMEEAALNLLLDWSDNYPFFIQLAGEQAWNIAPERDVPEITLEDAENAMSRAEQLRKGFFDERYVELGKHDLIPYAMKAIDLIEKEPSNDIGYKKLIVGILEANEGMENKRAVEIHESLLDLGFITLISR